MKKIYDITLEGLDKNRGLYRFCKQITEAGRKRTLNSYLTQIFEGRSGPGLYWLLPNKNNQYYLAFFPEEQYGEITHDKLWDKHVSPLIASHFKIKPELLTGYYEAFPRGRLEVGEKIHTWMVGCADEYPTGWNKEKLYQRLKVLPQDTAYEVDGHWLTDKEQYLKIKTILGL